jgi:N-acylneuraminate cytidylyltransferase
MKNIAFVPARKGSKGIYKKNIKKFCGQPLIYWVLNSLQKSSLIDIIVVATDGQEIVEVVNNFGFNKTIIYNRSEQSARDESPTENVIIEYLKNASHNPKDTFILVQATSPFTTEKDINSGLQKYCIGKFDSLLSCAKFYRFLWNSQGKPLNYNYRFRPRRQEIDGIFIENGAFYINCVENILKYKNRLSGNIGLYEMPEYTSLEIDEPDDWEIAQLIMKKYILNENK